MKWNAKGIQYLKKKQKFTSSSLSSELAELWGDKQNGYTKSAIAKVERTGKDTHNKVKRLEQQFRTATDWLNQAGVGVSFEDNIGACVKQRCLNYYELVNVMGNRPSTFVHHILDQCTDTYDNNSEISDADDEETK